MDDYGKKLTGRHNMVVLALFGLSAIKLYAHGYRRICNQPIDSNIRRLYSKMGFTRGEILELDDMVRIGTLVGLIARIRTLSKLEQVLFQY